MTSRPRSTFWPHATTRMCSSSTMPTGGRITSMYVCTLPWFLFALPHLFGRLLPFHCRWPIAHMLSAYCVTRADLSHLSRTSSILQLVIEFCEYGSLDDRIEGVNGRGDPRAGEPACSIVSL